MVRACILIIHLLFKTLRTSLFGKLLIFYNLGVMFTSGSILALLLMHYWTKVNSQTICHTTTIIFTLAVADVEVLGTNILYHLVFIRYRCYHLKSEICKRRSQFLFRRYTGYAAFILILLFFVTIAYDWRTGNGKYTILASGHCDILNQPSYNTILLVSFIVTINKFLQVIMFSAYLVYFYNFNMYAHVAQVTLQYNRQLFKIAIAMGGTVSLTYFTSVFVLLFPDHSDIVGFIIAIFLFIQQAVILASLICTKKMFTLCKAYFSRD